MDISIFVHYGTGSRIPPLTASLATRIIRNNVIILGMSSGLDLLDLYFGRAVREVASRSWSIPSPSLLLLTGSSCRDRTRFGICTPAAKGSISKMYPKIERTKSQGIITAEFPPEQEPAPPQDEVGTSEAAEDPGYLIETGQAVGEDGTVAPIIGGLPAVEGSAWDIGAPLDDRGTGLADEQGSPLGQAGHENTGSS